mgnify:CR=1 FL=1
MTTERRLGERFPRGRFRGMQGPPAEQPTTTTPTPPAAPALTQLKPIPGIEEELGHLQGKLNELNADMQLGVEGEIARLVEVAQISVEAEGILPPEARIATQLTGIFSREQRKAAALTHQKIQEAVAASNVEIGRQTFRAYALQYISGLPEITEVSDVVEAFQEEDASFIPSPADEVFIKKWLQKAQVHLTSAQGVSAETATGEKRKGLINQYSTRRSISSFGILSSAGDQLLTILTELTQPQLPPGQTTSDVRRALSEAGTDPEVVENFMVGFEAPLKAIVEDWAKQNASREILRSDMANLELSEIREMIRSETLKNMWTTQGLLLMLPFEKYRQHFIMPLIAATSRGVDATRPVMGGGGLGRITNPARYVLYRGISSIVPDWDELEGKYTEAREGGVSSWQAYSYAFENWDANAFHKFIVEVLMDPLTYFGVGLYGKILSPIPILGRGVARGERLFGQLVDMPFYALKEGAFRMMPKTGTMRILENSKLATETFRIANEVMQNRLPILQHTREQLFDVGQAAIGVVRKASGAQGPLADLGRFLLQRQPLDAGAVRGMATRLGAEIDDTMFDNGLIGFIEDLFDHTTGLGTVYYSEAVSAKLLLLKFGVIHNKRNMITARSIIKGVRQEVDNGVNAIFAADSVAGVTARFEAHVRLNLKARMTSPAILDAEKVGKYGAFITNAGAKSIHIWQNYLERFVTVPFARLHLLFFLYSPWNVVENGWKTILAGIWPFYRGEARLGLLGQTSGLRGTPEAFFRAQEISLQFGMERTTLDLAQAHTFARGSGRQKVKRGEMSGKSYRKALVEGGRQRNKTFSDLIADFPIIGTGRGNRITLQQQAWYLLKSYQNELWQRHPQTMQRSRDIADSLRGILEKEFAPREVDDILKHAFNLSSVGPGSLDNLASQITPPSVYARDVLEMASDYPNLPIGVQDLLVKRVMAGTIWDDMDALWTSEFPEMLWQEVFNSPVLMRRQIDDMIQASMEAPVRDLDDLKMRLQALGNITEDFHHVIELQLTEAQIYTRSLHSIQQKDAFYKDLFNNKLDPYMDTVQERVTQLGNRLHEVIKGNEAIKIDLTPQQLADYNDLTDLYVKQMQVIRETRDTVRKTELRLIEERKALKAQIDLEFSKGSGVKFGTDHPEVQAWWEKFYKARDADWVLGREKHAALVGHAGEVGSRAEVVTIPGARIPEGKLNPSDISYLFGSQPSDLAAAIWMPSLMQMRSRKAFVARVYAKATKVAKNAGITPEDMKYDKEAIGAVYDFLLRRMKVDPKTVSLLAPRQLELEALRKELTLYSLTRKKLFPLKGKDSLAEFSAAYKQALQDDPLTAVFGVQAVEAPVDVAPTVVDTVGAGLQRRGNVYYPKDAPVVEPTPPGGLTDEQLRVRWKEGGDDEAQELLQLRRSEVADDAMLLDGKRPYGLKPDIFSKRMTPKERGEAGYRPPEVPTEAQRASRIEDFKDDVKAAEDNVKAVSADDARDPGDLAEAKDALKSAKSDLREAKKPFDFVGHEEHVAAFKKFDADVAARRERNQIRIAELEDKFAAPPEPVIDMSVSPIHKVIIGGEARYITWLDYEGLGKNWYEYLGPDAPIPGMGGTGVYSKKAMVAKLETAAADIIPEPAPVLDPGDNWQINRQEAYDATLKKFALDFPDYERGTAFNSMMKAYFPFWTYEVHRLWYLPRQAIRTPGAYTTWGKYMDNTDNGYINVPGTSLEFNPLRGSISGVLRGLFYRDYPEFYDRFPMLASAMDQSNRFGFYPNILIQGALSLGGAQTGRSQTGEMLFPLISAPLELFVAAFPNSGPGQAIQELLLPARFRDMVVAQQVSMGGEFSGPALLNKRYSNLPFTDEEQKAWNVAQRWPALFNVLNSQIALFRFRPEERKDFQRQVQLLYEEHLGIPIKMQNDARKAGLSITDIIGSGLPPYLEALILDLEGAAEWRGLTTHLRESNTGQAMALIGLFWDNVDAERQTIKEEQEKLDYQVRSGVIRQQDWEMKTRKLNRKLTDFIESSRKTDAYEDVPITFTERMEFAAEHQLNPLILHPLKELQNWYFDFKLEDKFNPKTGVLEPNFDELYAYRRAIELSVPNKMLAEFEDWVQRNDTPLEAHRRQDYEEYIQPYLDAFDFVLSTYDQADQDVIMKALSVEDPVKRAALREQTTADGRQIVSMFESELGEFRINMRKLDPELDARLLFWRPWTITKPQNARTLQTLKNIRQTYGFLP